MSEKLQIWVAVFLGPDGEWCAAGSVDETPESIEKSWSMFQGSSITERRVITMEMDPPKAPAWLRVHVVLDESERLFAADTEDNKEWLLEVRKNISELSKEDKDALISELKRVSP